MFSSVLRQKCIIFTTELSFVFTASEIRIRGIFGTPGNVSADVLGLDRPSTYTIPPHELYVVQWTVQKITD